MAMDNSTRTGYERYYRVRAERYGWKPAGEPGYSPARTEPVYSHLNYFHFGEGQRTLASQMKSVIGLDNGGVVLVGCGFNWTGEGLIDGGSVGVAGVDISPYILSAQTTTEEQDIRDYCARSGINPDTDWVLGPPEHPQSLFLDGEWRIRPLDWWLPRAGNRTLQQVIGEAANSNQSRRAIKNHLGDDVHHIITGELLNSIEDADVLALLDLYAQLSSTSTLTRAGGADIYHMLSPLQVDVRQDPDLNWKTYDGWRTFLDGNGFTDHNIICTVPVQGRTLFEVM